MNFDMCKQWHSARGLRRDSQPSPFSAQTKTFEPVIFLRCGTFSKFKMAAASSSGSDEVDDLFSRFMSEVTSYLIHFTKLE